jgi:hypothetical protein
MARNTNKGKGVGGIQNPTQRKRKEMLFRDYMNRKMDFERKNKNS